MPFYTSALLYVALTALLFHGLLPQVTTHLLLDRLPRYRNILFAAIAALVVAEGWFVDGTQPVPLPVPSGLIPQGAIVLDVPFDDPFVNAAAQYRAVLGGYRTINGYSGYEAPHLTQLKKAFKEMRYDSIDEYHRGSDLYVIVRPEAAPGFAQWIAMRRLERRPEGPDAILYRLPRFDTSSAPIVPAN